MEDALQALAELVNPKKKQTKKQKKEKKNDGEEE